MKENVEVIRNSILIGKQGINFYSSLEKTLRNMNTKKKSCYSLKLKYFSALNDTQLGDIPKNKKKSIGDKALAMIHIIKPPGHLKGV